jgi:hypothetical protein
LHWIVLSNRILQTSMIPCPFAGPKNFCDGPNFLSKTKSLIAFSASSKTFVLAQKLNLLYESHLLV